MLALPGYSLTETLHESTETVVYRAEGPDGPVILKSSAAGFPQPGTVARLRNEFALGAELELDGTVRYLDLLPHGSTWVLVIEDFGARPLSWLLRPGAPAVSEEGLLAIAIALLDAVEELHRSDVVHRDISPNNIFFDVSSGLLKLGDLGLASRIPRTRRVAVRPGHLVGTVAYISPEQTGRMNRDVDYRTDLYSCGATLYHLASGRLPFDGPDLMSVVHGHIAREPLPLSAHRPDLPEQVSRIVLKLMSKAAEDRYQSAAGAAADLRRCRDALRDGGGTPDFELGTSDRSPIFTVSGRLVGRDPQLATLRSAFERVADGSSELLLVRGHSGIGKSVLVHEVLGSLMARQGLFFRGKYDYLTRTPFRGLADALRALLNQVLTGSEDEIARWRARVGAALEDEAAILFGLLPELKHLLGEQPAPTELDPVPARARFDGRLVGLVGALAGAEHPLVLFLDDLQWVDPASLRVLGRVVNDPEIHHLLLIGAWRDNEVDDAHPLSVALADWRRDRRTTIYLDTLGTADLAELVADSTETTPAEAEPLAEVLRQKTGGNPFFVVRYLYRLGDEGLLFEAPEGRGWRWNLAGIRQLEVADSVISMMLGQVDGYTEGARDLLARASSLGGTFDLHTLAFVAGVPAKQVVEGLWAPVRDGLVLPLGDTQDLYRGAEPEAGRSARFKFAHDKIREAAAEVVTGIDPDRMDLEIGRLLRDRIPAYQRRGRVLEFVDHLARGAALLDEVERDELSELLLEAGLRARAATAYGAAVRHLRRGIELTGETGWADRYERMVALHRGCVECVYLGGDTAGALALFEEVRGRVHGKPDLAALLCLVQRIYGTEDRLPEALQLGLEGLVMFGAAPPADPDAAQALMGQIGQEIGELLAEKGPGAMTDGPRAEDAGAKALMALLLETWLAALMLGNLPVVAFTALSLVRLSLKYGNSEASPCGYVAQAALCVFQGDYDAARMFGDAGLTLARKMGDVSLTPKALNTYCNFTGHMVRHMRENVPIYEESYQACLQTGERWWGAWAIHWVRVHRLLKGDLLDDVLERARSYHAYIADSGYVPLVWMSDVDQQVMLALMGRGDGPSAMDRVREEMATAGFEYGVYAHDLMRGWLALLWEDHDEALRWLDGADARKDVIPGGPAYSECFLYGALILAAQPDPEPHRERLDGYIERMKGWAENASAENFAHCHALMAAERARLDGQDDEARRLYDDAVRLARDNEYVHHAAMACELAGRFYLSRGSQRAARGYLEDALGLYGMWGAAAKVEQLKERYQELRQPVRTQQFPTISSASRSLTSTNLDLDTVLKASNALTGEIVLERLLGAILSIVLENAGADRGALLLQTDAGLRLQARAWPGQTRVLQDRPLDDCEELPLSVLRYAARVRRMVLEDDAVQAGRFASDPDVRARSVQSLLCVPLTHQGRLVGLLYVENTRLAAAFTDDRVELLRILSAQAATALENATLYATLEQKVEQRTAQLQHKNEELERTLRRLEETQSQLVQSEKMAALGQLIAGVAHEINTPVGAIRASSENIRDSLDQTLADLPGLLASLSEERTATLLQLIARSLEQRDVLESRELRKRRRRLERVLDAAGVADADDVADTLVDIGIYEDVEAELDLLRSPDARRLLRATWDIAVLQRNSRTIRDAVQQVSRVVFALKSFVHRGIGEEMVRSDVLLGLENVLTIHHNYLKRGVDLVRRFGDDVPPIACHPDELQQVWTNLIHNALQAMEFQGRLEVAAAVEEEQLVVRIIDDGPGIPAEVQGRIWDAFFTTKPAGEGSGLGLHICRDIVERHGGTIGFDSRPGRTAFEVSLPVGGEVVA